MARKVLITLWMGTTQDRKEGNKKMTALRRKFRTSLLRPALMSTAAIAMLVGLSAPTLAGGTLRIAMTASDIPLPNGQTDQGAEGMRFMGYTVFDALVGYDLSSPDKPVTLIPGLATEWSVDPADTTKWTFKLRPGVKFHDGSDFNAEAVVWNLAKILDKDAPQYDERQAAQGRGRIPSIATYKVVDDMTVEITTKAPEALIPYQMAWIVMSSPAQWEKVGKNWDEFLKAPSGTGPFKVESYVPRERAVLVPNTEYWDKDRISTLDKLVLMPVADPSARVAALRSGQVDWIEAPPSDSIESLRGAKRRRRIPSRACAARVSRSPRTSTRMSGRGTSRC